MPDQNNNEQELMEIVNVFMRRNNQLYLETCQLRAENRLLRNANRNLVTTGQKMAKDLREAKGGKCDCQATATGKDFFFCPNITHGEH